ncbi:MAG: AraC family transcriptional regulator, partial [Sphingobium sp.]
EAFHLAGFGTGSTALLTRLVSLLLIATLRGTPRYLAMLQAPRADPIDQALRLISANPSAPWTVEGLARTVGMGRSNFAAHFSARTGRAPMEVITGKRMEQALQLLRQSGHKIAEIAEITGYGSEAAFSRRFTRHYGSPPSQMRGEARPEEAQADAKAGWPQLLPRGRLGETALPLRPAAKDRGAEPLERPFVLGHRRTGMPTH